MRLAKRRSPEVDTPTSLRMHHATSVGIAKQLVEEVPLSKQPLTYYPCFISNESFPGFLAKREIIANAFIVKDFSQNRYKGNKILCFPTNVLSKICLYLTTALSFAVSK